jgi:heat-inducible transcriptional repressor
MLPQTMKLIIHHVQLVPITPSTALVVVVTNAGVLKDTIIRVPESATPDMLQKISYALTYSLRDKTSADIPSAVSSVRKDIADHAQFAEQIVNGIAENIAREDKGEIVLAEDHLLSIRSTATSSASARLAALEPQGTWMAFVKTPACRVPDFIGPSLAQRNENCSMYRFLSCERREAGTVGVLGPVRMDYAEGRGHLIPC